MQRWRFLFRDSEVKQTVGALLWKLSTISPTIKAVHLIFSRRVKRTHTIIPSFGMAKLSGSTTASATVRSCCFRFDAVLVVRPLSLE